MTNVELCNIVKRLKEKYEYKKEVRAEDFDIWEHYVLESIKTPKDIEEHGFEFILEHVAEFYMYYVFKFCGCGCPSLCYYAACDLLKIVMDKQESDDYKKYGVWVDLIDKNPSYLYMLYHLDNIEMVEHGSSIYGCWITKYGKDFMAIANEYFKEDFKSIEKEE